MDVEQNPRQIKSRFRTDAVVLLGIAAMVAVVHLLTNNRYGFHRDELQFLSDARHLDWGFVRVSTVDSFSGTHRPRNLRRVAGGTAALFGHRAGVGCFCYRAHGSGAWWWTDGPGCGGPCGRSLAAAPVRGHRVPIHDLRLLVVGADCLVRDSPSKERESAVVAGDWRDSGRWPDDQVFDSASLSPGFSEVFC